MQQASPERPSRPVEPLPEAREVASQVWKITQPIPFPLRTVNMHALVGKDGWVLVDAGMGTPEGRAALSAGLKHAGLSLDNLQAIVLTHHHPDHIGMSGELHEKTGAPVYMHPIDEQGLHDFWSNRPETRFRSVSRFFLRHGLPQTNLWVAQMEPQAVHDIIRVPPHEAFTLVEDGETLHLAGEEYRVIWTPGHSDGQICLFRARDGVFLAADHVLPRITPNVGLYSERDRPNPLADYLESLAKVAKLPAQIVLPGHGEPFSNLAARTTEITEHHYEREGQLIELLKARPQNAYELTIQLFKHRQMNDESRRMAVAEVLSHLEHMRYNGQMKQRHTEDGFILYTLL